MVEDKTPSKDKEHSLNFGLLIQKILSSDGVRFSFESQNEGIPDAEVVLIVEAWLDKVKQRLKDDITGNMMFGGDVKKK